MLDKKDDLFFENRYKKTAKELFEEKRIKQSLCFPDCHREGYVSSVEDFEFYYKEEQERKKSLKYPDYDGDGYVANIIDFESYYQEIEIGQEGEFEI